eukprot:TRINITY_DN8415_c0_g1_i22.p3 TRINITY_DN8415_c0_g1~~TRINITY_DN8415_c0_g1_i22.p3  ORF type:complete len:131 (-),score=17.77 TRINITY_DN8415_c0_g1_i22:781-1173(-)
MCIRDRYKDIMNRARFIDNQEIMSAILEGIKSFWTGYSKDTEDYCERRLLHEWSNISPSLITIQDIPISSAENDTIHCISVSTGDRIPFVFLPGYATSGAMYYKLMKRLGSEFDLYFVDMRGMGGYLCFY